MDGVSKVSCQAGGSWTSPPVCVRLCLDTPPAIVHGEYSATGNRLNDTVAYTCDTGYTITGNETDGKLKLENNHQRIP